MKTSEEILEWIKNSKQTMNKIREKDKKLSRFCESSILVLEELEKFITEKNNDSD